MDPFARAQVRLLASRVSDLESGGSDAAEVTALKARIQRVLHGQVGLYTFRDCAENTPTTVTAGVVSNWLKCWIDILEGKA